MSTDKTDSGWRKRQIALDVKAENARELGLDYEIHSCSPFCTQPMCVAVRDAVQAEREACAGLCDRFANRMMTAEECAAAIRARGQA
jgi:hypothetical protein